MTDQSKKDGSTSASRPDEAGKMNPAYVEDAIGKALKRVYGSMVQEPLPDRFQQLLKDLEKAGSRK